MKIGRAKEHFNSLKYEMLPRKETGPYRIVRKCDAKGRHHTLVVEIKNPAPVVRSSNAERIGRREEGELLIRSRVPLSASGALH
jgi:hypothetical protein